MKKHWVIVKNILNFNKGFEIMTSPATQLYFSYGSNLNLKQMKSRCPDFKILGIAYLKNSTLTFPSFSESWGGGVASFVQKEHCDLWGVLYLLTEQDLERLRPFEGYVHGRCFTINEYNEIEVEVMFENNAKKCMTYEARATGDFSPSKSYLDTIIQGAIDNLLPLTYIDSLKKIKYLG